MIMRNDSKRKPMELEAEKRGKNQEIYGYTEMLVEEMNLRLFLLQEDSKEILIVDSICVTSIF